MYTRLNRQVFLRQWLMVTGVFDELGPAELTEARAQVAAAGLDAARLVAAARLVLQP